MPVIDDLLSLVAPHTCVICQAEGSAMCNNCVESLPRLPSRCYMCQAISKDNLTCLRCQRKSKIKGLFVFTDYSTHSELLLKKYKFNYAQPASKIISKCIVSPLPYGFSPDIVTNVPSATNRIRQRGFDHSRLLARRVASHISCVHLELVVRTGQTRQVGSSRKQRFSQLKKEFVIARKNDVFGKDILIVDDVVTTGATLETMAKILKDNGASRVYAAVFAQKI